MSARVFYPPAGAPDRTTRTRIYAMSFAPNSPAARDVAYYLHPYTNLVQHETQGPHILTKGDGVFVTDDDGKEYLEGMAGLWCAALGFSERRLATAAARQMAQLPFYHGFAGQSVEVVVDLAEKLVRMAPHGPAGPMSKAFFTSSGSEANDTQIKLVWYYNNALGRPHKKKIIARRGAYHGVTLAAASLTGLEYVTGGFDVPIDRILHTDFPHYWRHAEPGESEEDFATRLAESLERLILAEGPETVAAFIAEPVMGAGGVVPPPATYFEKVQAVLRKHDVLFIADEVITGFGRTGNMFGCETYDIRPDMISFAKSLTAAYVPMGAVVISDEIYQVLKEASAQRGMFGHGYTYSGHPLAAAVALEALTIYEERDIPAHVARLSPRFLGGLNSFADHPLVGDVRGVGLIAGVELAADRAAKRPFDAAAKVGALVSAKAQAQGLIVRPLGGDVVALCPPMSITADEIELLLERFGRALDDAHAQLKADGLA